jgi:predicted SAM-dependent methyltransferase
MPWWSKILVKIFLSRIPFNYNFWKFLGIFRHGYMAQASYGFDVFNNHVSRAGLKGKLNGKVVLELGPGDSIATAIIAASYGAKAILVDVGRFATTDMSRYNNIIVFLKNAGLNPPDISTAKSIEEVLLACNAKYLTHGLKSFSSVDTSSIDLIFSQAVLEHIRKHEFVGMMKECCRVLTCEGVASHRIDLKDHLGGSLNNLRFNEYTWESHFFANSGFYTNRIRFIKMLDMFKESGFASEVINVRRWESLPIKKTLLSKEFSFLPDKDLTVSGFDVMLTKDV